ncbi:hypothetical protein NOVOSPHI9U_310045 [Novosphingobium sp. 9U]|nr:hypothetical protein NOVOSPHI9U_310045 [Novosphingobium sp. 9U]
MRADMSGGSFSPSLAVAGMSLTHRADQHSLATALTSDNRHPSTTASVTYVGIQSGLPPLLLLPPVF